MTHPMDTRCEGHPAGPFDPMGETVYCDGSCQPDEHEHEWTKSHGQTWCAECGAIEEDEDPTAGFLYEAFWDRIK